MEFFKAYWKPILYGIASLIGAVVLWASLHHERAPVGAAMPAAVAPEVMHEAKTDTPIQSGTVKTYPKAVKQKLNLPAQVQADDTKQVIEASKLPADDHPQTVTTVIDTKTGETETFRQRDPLPLFAVDTTGEAGVFIGLRNGSMALRADVRQSVFMIKAVHVGGIASLDQPIGGAALQPSTFIGGGIWGHW
jgi:hypothetical protein